MSTPIERTSALAAAGRLLRRLLLLEPGATISEEDRREILYVLRHYPDAEELELLARDVARHCPRAMLSPLIDGKQR